MVLLAHGDLVGRTLELADELVVISKLKVGLGDIEHKNKGFSRFLAPGGIHHGSTPWVGRVVLEQWSCSLKRFLKGFHCFLPIQGMTVVWVEADDCIT